MGKGKRNRRGKSRQRDRRRELGAEAEMDDAGEWDYVILSVPLDGGVPVAHRVDSQRGALDPHHKNVRKDRPPVE